MKKEIIIKHIKGEATDIEHRMVMEWFNISESNKKYYYELKNIDVLSALPDSLAPLSDARKLIRRSGSREVKIWRNLFAAASVLLLLVISGTILLYINKIDNLEVVGKTYKTIAQNPDLFYYTDKGVKAIVYLPDSSKVWMNSDTKITFPKEFSGDVRRVSISGEAFFDVVSNPDVPMIVSTQKGMKIEVLGTKFMVRSYDNDDDAQATLYEGRINIVSEKGRVRELLKTIRPNESIIYKNRIFTQVKDIDTSKVKAWTNGYLIFDKTPLNEVVKKLERWHGKTIEVKDSSILGYKFTAKFKSESIFQILEMLKFSTPIDFENRDDMVILSKR